MGAGASTDGIGAGSSGTDDDLDKVLAGVWEGYEGLAGGLLKQAEHAPFTPWGLAWTAYDVYQAAQRHGGGVSGWFVGLNEELNPVYGLLNVGADLAAAIDSGDKRGIGRGVTTVVGILAAHAVEALGSGKAAAVEGGSTWKPGPNDVNWKGTGRTVRDAIPEAFDRTGIPREQFEITKWAKDANGKSFPVEWRAPNGAEVNVDLGHVNNGPTDPHVGFQTGGKRGSGGAVRGHILLDDVPYNRPGR